MKNIINSLFLRKLELIYLFSNKMEYSEQPKKLCLQLPVTLALDVFAVEPNFLARSIVSRFDSLIVNLLLKFLGMMEVFPANNHQFS